MGTYVTYEELNNGTPSTIDAFRQLLCRYQRSKVLYLCGLINCVTRKWHGAVDKRAHDDLASIAFRPALLNHLAAHPESPKRILFHRLQTMFVAKEITLYGTEDGIDPLTTPHWGGLGEAFIMANDHLRLELEETNRTLRILTENLSVNEYSFPCDLRAVLARANLALTQFMPQPSELNIRDLFQQASGFTLDQFRVMCVGLICQYFPLDGEVYKKDKSQFLIGQDFFRSTAIAQETVNMFLKDMSAAAEDLKSVYQKRNHGPLDFTPFRDKPLVKIDQTYFPIDIKFLVEKFEAGVFWKINGSVDRRTRSSLHSAWGKGFESYSNWLLAHSTDGTINVLHKTPTYEDNNDQVTDAIIVCGHKAIFIECKIAMMRAEIKYGGSPTDLTEEIYKKFVESNERPQGIKQLAVAINTVFSKERSRLIEGIDLSKIRMVYPVLLTRDSIGGSIGLSKYLRQFFKPLVNEKLVSIDVGPLFCLSIDQMEEIADVLQSTSLAELLYGWWRNDRTLGTNFLMASGSGNRKQSRKLPDALTQALDDLFNESMTYFPEVAGAGVQTEIN